MPHKPHSPPRHQPPHQRWRRHHARVVLRVVGADALLLPAVAPALMPRAFATSERLAMLAPATVFLNAAALRALGNASSSGTT